MRPSPRILHPFIDKITRLDKIREASFAITSPSLAVDDQESDIKLNMIVSASYPLIENRLSYEGNN